LYGAKKEGASFEEDFCIERFLEQGGKTVTVGGRRTWRIKHEGTKEKVDVRFLFA